MKIKILFYIDTLIGGGAEKVLRNLVNSMDLSKFEITVQTTWQESTEGYLAEGINYKYCYKKRNALTELLFRLEANAGLVYPLHIKSDYDIEVAYLEAAPTKLIASSTNKNAKKLAWVHCDLAKNTTDINRFVEKTKPWYLKYDKAVCVSESVKESFVELFEDLPEAVTIYNTIDDSEIKKKAEESLPETIKKDKLTIISLGRFMPQKNMLRLLKATKTLLNSGLDFNLWLLGEGNERPLLEKYIKENNLYDNVTLFGFCENPYPYIKAADFSVCSSDYEGFSTFITESLILGKTAVTTDCNGMRELLGNSECGLITGIDDNSFTEGLRKMVTEPDLLKEYTEKANIRGRSFSKKALTEKTERLFLEMLNK